MLLMVDAATVRRGELPSALVLTLASRVVLTVGDILEGLMYVADITQAMSLWVRTVEVSLTGLIYVRRF